MTVPLIVGVTGHRDLVADEVPQIREQVKRFFTELQSSFPELPLLLLSRASTSLYIEHADKKPTSLEAPTVIDCSSASLLPAIN